MINNNSKPIDQPIEDEKSKMTQNLRIRCKTTNGDFIIVDYNLMLQSKVFAQMFNDLKMAEMKDLDDFEFPVEINTEVFKKVVQWMEISKDLSDPMIREIPVTRERLTTFFPDENSKFLNICTDDLGDLIMAASFLDLRTLYIYGCQTMANLIKDKSPEQVRELLCLPDDLTDEEKQQVRRDNIWCNF